MQSNHRTFPVQATVDRTPNRGRLQSNHWIPPVQFAVDPVEATADCRPNRRGCSRSGGRLQSNPPSIGVQSPDAWSPNARGWSPSDGRLESKRPPIGGEATDDWRPWKAAWNPSGGRLGGEGGRLERIERPIGRDLWPIGVRTSSHWDAIRGRLEAGGIRRPSYLTAGWCRTSLPRSSAYRPESPRRSSSPPAWRAGG